ncbi:hypothetical protein [Peribacillus asahii]|uniref:hypothetical protein n=1 Tax=Peribacillus asahii TaxID=228899 RepID=UPI0015FDDA21|nr:hypothetical protein [Peribacillus asahii]
MNAVEMNEPASIYSLVCFAAIRDSKGMGLLQKKLGLNSLYIASLTGGQVEWLLEEIV